MMLYSFDADAFITSWRYLPPHTFPDLWEGLSDLVDNGRLRVALKVFEEVIHTREDDPLRVWLTARKDRVIYPFDERIQQSVRTVMAACPDIIDIDMCKHEGDPWAVALALTQKGCVVTFEEPSARAKPLKIPNVCSQFDIPCHKIYEVFRLEGWRWELHR